ncbi:hypothetical protein [Allosphingosinicella vermicomposti]|uniref:hypothetical protein n=1 Tax=Allosphingosinicella vermicomposti TaxID=614671 RepID=UPI00131A5A56|nr:hypothetical protein [Allosphingosinicella vermicomposti]
MLKQVQHDGFGRMTGLNARHPGESRGLMAKEALFRYEIPAFAGMTFEIEGVKTCSIFRE